MAKPTRPIEIWAVQDVILPVSGEINKVRPIDDLWSKGYDMGQKPAIEEWNYIWNMTTSWLKYISDEQIPGLDDRYLRRSQNLADLGDKAASRSNLNVYSKEESEQRYVNVTGDQMTGNLGVPYLFFTRGANSDGAWMEAKAGGPDKTYMDIGISDNYGDPSAAETDIIRFRFKNTDGSEFSMVEINALDGTGTGYMRVFGQLWARQLTIAGNISWTGMAQGANLNLSGTMSSASVATGNLAVNSQNAVVGGRNIVRAINGVTADGNGDLSLTINTTAASVNGGNGWWRDNSTGIIEQWGIVNYSKLSSTSEYIPFNFTFPNACQNIQMCNLEDFNNEGNVWRVRTFDASGFTFSNGGGNMYTGYFWRAIGY